MFHKGYPLIITLPDKMSMEKELLLRCLGAEIVRTPTAAPSHSPESNLGPSTSFSFHFESSRIIYLAFLPYAGVAKTLAEKIPYGIILDQYYNPNNPLAHELATGPEIIDAIEMDALSTKHKSSGKVDALVAGAGTGGTLTGLSTKFTKYYGEGVVAIVGVDPVSAIRVPLYWVVKVAYTNLRWGVS
jgi:cystathionine beta-synthase